MTVERSFFRDRLDFVADGLAMSDRAVYALCLTALLIYGWESWTSRFEHARGFVFLDRWVGELIEADPNYPDDIYKVSLLKKAKPSAKELLDQWDIEKTKEANKHPDPTEFGGVEVKPDLKKDDPFADIVPPKK